MPLYEYACRSCGERTERMRKVEDRLRAPTCEACDQPTVLAMSVPGMVGGGAPGLAAEPWGHSCGGGGCCGGGACSPGLN
jgi:putative FmdB family regulatory protein